MNRVFRAGVAVALASPLAPGPMAAQRGLSKRDGQGPVSVTITLMEAPATGSPVKVKVSLDTHSVALDGIKFEEVVVLGGPDGVVTAPIAVEHAKGTGHHRKAVVAFPHGGACHLLAVPSAVAAQERPYEWGGWHVHRIWGLSGLWHLGIMLLILAFWGVVIVGVVLSIRWLASQGRRPQSDPALEILRQRYARGDIGKDEFDVKKRDLTCAGRSIAAEPDKK